MRSVLRAGLATLVILALAGCSSLPFFAKDDAATAQAATPAAGAASAAEARADYRLAIEAPSDLRKLLGNYLDLARFQNAPDTDAIGALKSSADAGDAPAATKLAALRREWPLRVGDAFRQGDWSGAKSSALAGLRADGYANADWSRTDAQIDAPANRARLAVEVDSGPLYRLGPVRVDGLQRYPEEAVLNLAEFHPGEPYSEKLLLDYQERLQKLGLFEG
ncbi:MAG: POTRA domain-containing protein, partial [Burkholderiaceae bacterium]